MKEGKEECRTRDEREIALERRDNNCCGTKIKERVGVEDIHGTKHKYSQNRGCQTTISTQIEKIVWVRLQRSRVDAPIGEDVTMRQSAWVERRR
jgi:hypothetical protein